MRNLHRYYYKDYFSSHIDKVDDEADSLSFCYIIKEDKKAQLADSESKKLLEKEISTIKTKNKAIAEKRNGVLIGNGRSVEKDKEYKLKDEICIPYITESNKSRERGFYYMPLRISYPGLVTGVGIDHEAKIEGEFKLGVHFDWTYGMPVVYGSSVKGVLRAWFREFYEGELDPDDLMMDIFSGVYNRDIKAEKEAYGEKWERMVKDPEKRIYKSRRSIYERDIFFDAVLTAPDKKGRILCSDSITPHGNDPLKNPTPLTFLKIAPGCMMEFRFKLEDTKDTNGAVVFSKTNKINLFKEILTTIGVGAKTNVGYGQLK